MSALVIPSPTPPDPPPAPPLTSAEFGRLYAGRYVEVIDGLVREIAMPSFDHGKICTLFNYFLTDYVLKNDAGHVASNDSFVRISESPLKVLGPDICYVSYERLPRGSGPVGVLPVAPDLVVEVRSPSDTWVKVFSKVVECLSVGVRAVVVLNAGTANADVCRPEVDQQMFTAEQELTLPDVLPGFAIRVGRLFED